MQVGFRDSNRVVHLTLEQLSQGSFFQPTPPVSQILEQFDAAKQWLEVLDSATVQSMYEQGITHADQPLAFWEWMNEHRSEIEALMVQRFRFVTDDILELVIQFLQMEKPADFHTLPGLVRTKDSPHIIGNEKLKPFAIPIEWMSKLGIGDIMKLSVAAVQLGIRSLGSLCAVFIAKYIYDTEEDQVRKQFQVPEKFRDATLQKIRDLFRDRPWESNETQSV